MKCRIENARSVHRRDEIRFGNGKIQTVCKPGSVHAASGAGRPFLWDGPYGPPRATNPGDGSKILPRPCFRTAPAAPIRSCSRWGLPCQPCHQGCGALLPHRFTLAAGEPEAVCFLWHCPWGRPRRRLAGTVFPWSPDFPPARFSPCQRPSNRLDVRSLHPRSVLVNASDQMLRSVS